MNSIATVIVVLVCGSSWGTTRRTTVCRANIIDRVYSPHVGGGHLYGGHLHGGGGHGPQYRKISLIGGGSGGGGSYLSVPAVASASITSAASLAVPNRHRRPLSANYVEIKPRLSSYYSRSGGSGHGAVVGNGYLGRGTTNCKGSVLGSRQNGLRDRLQLTSKNFDLNEPDGGHWSRLQSFARPTCHHSGGGFCC